MDIQHTLARPLTHSRTTVKSVLMWGIQSLCLLAWLAQVLIDRSSENLIAATLVLASTSLLVQYLRVSAAMTTHPLSSFALLGFSASSQFISLLAQSADGAAFVHYLRVPLLTFSVLAAAHVAAVMTHFAYRHFTPFSGASAFIAQKIYSPLNLHRIPKPLALWFFSGVGLAATVFGGGASGDVSGKFLAGYAFFMWAPYLIPVYISVVGDTYCQRRQQFILLGLYTAGIIAIALVKNYRAMLFAAPMQVTFLFLLYQCRGEQPVSKAFLQRVAILAVLGALLLPVMSDMVTAMEIARANRGKSTPMEMMQETYEAFTDKAGLQKYREEGAMSLLLKPYDERYLSNPLFGRFTETKFHDNMLYFGSMFGEEERQQLIRNQLDKMIAITPQNALDFLEIKFKKDDYLYSSGDFYLNLNHGGSLGGYATGSIWADLYVIFGYGFPFVIFLLLTPVFILMDALSRFEKGLFICPTALCSMWPLFLYGIGSESISAKVNQITRGSLQQVLLYAILAFAAVTLLRLFRQEAFVPVGGVRHQAPHGQASPTP